jgi:hypothetical protein
MALSIITKIFVGVLALIRIAAKNKVMSLKLELQDTCTIKK